MAQRHDTPEAFLHKQGVLFASSVKDEGDMGDRDDDAMEAIWKNRQQFFMNLGLPRGFVTAAAYLKLEHGDRIYETRGAEVRRCDGLYTNVPGLPLLIATGDCFPVMVFDARERRVALLHCGWQGTRHHLARNLLEKHWGLEYDAPRLADVHVFFGPGICGACYRHREEPAQLNDHSLEERALWEDWIRRESDGHYYVDLSGFIAEELWLYGIPFENIRSEATCTYEHP